MPSPTAIANVSDIHLTIRFSTSQPDIPLSISSPQTTPIAALKPLIRSHLPPETSSNRLRLIHAGKALHDSATLTSSLKIVPPPPLPTPPTSLKGKERAVEQDATVPVLRTYVHCVIGDAKLSVEELQAEKTLADDLIAAKTGTGKVKTLSKDGVGSSSAAAAASTTLSNTFTQFIYPRGRLENFNTLDP